MTARRHRQFGMHLRSKKGNSNYTMPLNARCPSIVWQEMEMA